MKKQLKYFSFLVLITPICFELALRILGHSPYKQLDYTIESNPELCIEHSNEMGFSLGEGTFDVTINKGLEYTATHKNGKRITRSQASSKSLNRVFLMGCSFTYGMGVDDSLSFPFLVQSRLENFNIENFGVPGFGTVQSYLQLENEIAAGRIPEAVVLNFCDFHLDRNSLIPLFRRSLVIGFERSNPEVSSKINKSRFPFIQDQVIKHVPYSDLYSVWPGRETFASVNYLQTQRDMSDAARIDVERNSFFIFRKFQKLCEKHAIRFIVTGLTQTQKTTRFLYHLNKRGVETHNISINLKSKKYNSMPYDSHPNARAHAHFARKIIQILED